MLTVQTQSHVDSAHPAQLSESSLLIYWDSFLATNAVEQLPPHGAAVHPTRWVQPG